MDKRYLYIGMQVYSLNNFDLPLIISKLEMSGDNDILITFTNGKSILYSKINSLFDDKESNIVFA